MYSKFLPNLTFILAPLYTLLQKESHWFCGSKQLNAFSSAKKLLNSLLLIDHYNTDNDLTLYCDASPYRVRAVLSHQREDGTVQPIAFASRSLSSAEKHYSQLDKESLALIFDVKKFRKHLYGRSFTLFTDHKPLMHLPSESKAIPSMASTRIQRWALALSYY